MDLEPRGRLMRRTLWKILARRKRRIPKAVILVDAAVVIALAFPLAVHATEGNFPTPVAPRHKASPESASCQFN